LHDRLGYRFTDDALLTLALTHRSWCAENPGTDSNERLEFLGDAVLGLAVTEFLYHRHPDRPEGELAPMRAAVVNRTSLARAARSIDLGRALRLGRGEEHAGGRDKPSILADAIEAVFGAVYLDGGYDPAREVVERVMGKLIVASELLEGTGDFKTSLQELVAARHPGEMPEYHVVGSGPDHAKEFRAEVRLLGRLWGEGRGRSKKEAEQAAAGAAYAALADDADTGATTSGGGPNIDA
jgi:ribonuclease-3